MFSNIGRRTITSPNIVQYKNFIKIQLVVVIINENFRRFYKNRPCQREVSTNVMVREEPSDCDLQSRGLFLLFDKSFGQLDMMQLSVYEIRLSSPSVTGI